MVYKTTTNEYEFIKKQLAFKYYLKDNDLISDMKLKCDKTVIKLPK